MDGGGLSAAERAAVLDIARRRVDEAAAARFADLVRPSVALTAAHHEGGAEAGFIGGFPGLPEGCEWPRYGDRPMVLLAQLDCAVLAPLIGPEWRLPRAGHLLFFHDDEFTAEFRFGEGDDGCRVLHLPDVGPTPTPTPAIPVIPALPLVARRALSAPGLADPEADLAAAGDVLALLDLVEDLAAALPVPRHRLLGWCDGDTPRPKGHRPLLQLEAEPGTAWGEVVNVSFWIRDEDLRAGDLGAVRRSYETA